MKKIRIGTIGSSFLVGKTSICRNYLGEEFSSEDIVTIGMEKYEKDVEYTKNEKTIKTKIHIIDTTGNERYEESIMNYIKKCDGILLVYAINEEKSFNDIEKWVKKIREKKPVDNYPIVLIGNKIDLEKERVISKEKGEEIAKKYNFPFYETSAKTGENINESFECLIDLIIQYKENEIENNKEIIKVSKLKKDNMKVLYSNNNIYIGQINKNKRNGKGKMTYNDIGIYDGNWENDKRNGYGVFNYNNENIYKGYWENNKRNGYGVFNYNNENIYEGYWENDMKNGEGTIKYNNKKILKGNFINDKREGDFIVTFFKNKDKIEIKFKNDKIIGEGIYRFYNENKIIKGIFDDNFNLIKGKLKEEDSEYEGEFNDEYNKEGKGILKYNNGIIYEGEFKNNKMNGRGFLCLNDKDYKLLKDNEILFNNQNIKEIFKLNINDSIYHGEFYNNKKKGYGIYIIKNTMNNLFYQTYIYCGNFIDDKKNDFGKIYFKNGNYLDSYWKDDLLDNTKDGILYLFFLNNPQKKKYNNLQQWFNHIKKEEILFFGNEIKQHPILNNIR